MDRKRGIKEHQEELESPRCKEWDLFLLIEIFLINELLNVFFK